MQERGGWLDCFQVLCWSMVRYSLVYVEDGRRVAIKK